MKQRLLLLLAFCFAAPAQAGLFSDDEARKQIQQLEERVLKLEDASKLQTKSMMDFQGQIEALNTEIRKLRGQNEELAHGLQDAEKREKDFYVDLDTRLRRFESSSEAAPAASGAEGAAPADRDDPVAENRAYEAAYSLYKGGSHASAAKAFLEFLKKYPLSVHVPNANYWLANAFLALKDYESALGVYRELRKNNPSYSKDADVLLNIAACQQGLKQGKDAQKTLKQLISKYPSSEAAGKAKKQLSAK